MASNDLKDHPRMLYADRKGRIYQHSYYRMAGFSGMTPQPPKGEELMPMPEFSKLFFIPDCPPVGLDPATGQYEAVREAEGPSEDCFAVAAFLEPGLVRSLLPAVDYRPKSYTLPTWAYTAVGYRQGRYWVPGFRIEYNHRWDPRNYDDRDLVPAIERYLEKNPGGELVKHLTHCATRNHCFAAKNLFFGRWEAPLPVSQVCNADCLGCLSLQTDQAFEASHQRLSFRPSEEEIVSVAVRHLTRAEDAIVSFGQGCEGEPLSEHELIAKSIGAIRSQTKRGTINLNTNGSSAEKIRKIAEQGLDSVRISLSSARDEYYKAYFRPKSYALDDVVDAIRLSVDLGLYTMINYLVFPGITDQEEEIEAMMDLIRKTQVNFIHLKNLNIDPQLYISKMPMSSSPAVGMREMAATLEREFPDLRLGYFNQAAH